MLSFVDLGTLVSYRLAETKVETEDGAGYTVDAVPDVTFQHVFAPSVSVVFGLSADRPFSAGFTARMAPKLRTLAETEEQRSTLRLSAFVGLDLTLLRF